MVSCNFAILDETPSKFVQYMKNTNFTHLCNILYKSIIIVCKLSDVVVVHAYTAIFIFKLYTISRVLDDLIIMLFLEDKMCPILHTIPTVGTGA